MKKLITIIVILFAGGSMMAQDTVVVQTLDFNMITQRRGKFKFPDDASQFRKIIMKYTLKCDPRTTQDGFDCGEWDYLTYNIVNQPTGRFDSTSMEHPYFRIGQQSPDTLDYTTIPYNNVYQRYYYNKTLTNPQNEESFNIGSTNGSFTLSGSKGRFQYILSPKELKDFGLTKGDISRIAINVLQPSDADYRVTIRMKNAPVGQFTNFVNTGFDTVYSFTTKFNQTGWKTFDMLKSFNWTGFGGILFEISYEKMTSGSEPVIDAMASPKCLMATGNDRYLFFDGVNDYAILDSKLKALENVEKFTLEIKIKVNEWQSWNRIFGNEKTCIELGDKIGQIYCIVRNPDNTHGNAQSVIAMNDWYNITMVFDGTQPSNEKKLKLFVNGELRSLSFSQTIPSMTSSEEFPLSINSGYYSNQTMKGGMDEIRLWNTALPDSIISVWYNRPADDSHPFKSSLIAYYSLDNDTAITVTNEADARYPATLYGCPEWMDYSPEELMKKPSSNGFAPLMRLYRASYSSKLDSVRVLTTRKEPPVSLMKYSIVNYKAEPTDVSYVWKAGYSYTFDSKGNRIDSIYHPKENTIINYKLKYYGKPFEIFKQWEIGRYITPYGINLDLGPEGFTWYYDVTDYAPLLQGEVDFSAGNQQELIDVKFLFIKGTAPRDVISIKEPWGSFTSFSYKDLSENNKLNAKTVTLNPLAKQFKLRTRFTGHGHNSNNGQYPHCCEWKDNTHYILLNDQSFAEWHVWQENDCALNPVFPQGGTWPGSREGWCPGDVVKDFDFEITSAVANSMVKIDYDITKVPTDNQGMGGGNYVVAMQLFEYGDFKFNSDVEIYNVVMPSSLPLYSRVNPVCANPKVIVRNNGRNPLTSILFKYKVSGGVERDYLWKGNLNSNQISEIIIPQTESTFWIGDGKNRFMIEASIPGVIDEYTENDSFVSDFNMPDLLPREIIIEYKTNNRANDYTYAIVDVNGVPVHNKRFSVPDRVYYDTLKLGEGCYTFTLTDRYNMGLSYWAYSEQGSGYVRILDILGKPIKTFNSDFGNRIYYSFNLGGITFIQENDLNNFVEVFPNPSDGNINVLVNYNIGPAKLSIVDIDGNEFHQENLNVTSEFHRVYDLPELVPGMYFVRIQNDKYNLIRKFVRK